MKFKGSASFTPKGSDQAINLGKVEVHEVETNHSKLREAEGWKMLKAIGDYLKQLLSNK